MVALIQRVERASVRVEGETVGAIERGLLILLGVHERDTEDEAAWVARKCANLRIFPDEDGKMNRSLSDTEGEALVVSQFTLYGDTARGNRPSFTAAAPPEQAEALYEAFNQRLGEHLGQKVQTGVFGAMMKIDLINDGPVTLWVEKAS